MDDWRGLTEWFLKTGEFSNTSSSLPDIFGREVKLPIFTKKKYSKVYNLDFEAICDWKGEKIRGT